MLQYAIATAIGAAVYAVYHVLKTYILHPVPAMLTKKIDPDFKTVGVVKQIFIYPLDGGPAREADLAFCTKTGLKADSFEDRSYVAYSKGRNSAILNVLKPELVTRNIKKLLSVILRLHRVPEHKEVEINYLGGTMTVEDEGDDVANAALHDLGNIAEGLRIGYCSPRNREEFYDNRVVYPDGRNTTEVVDRFSPYFATYTLINSKSVEYLEKQTNTQISPSQFRANVVIDGPEFCEDKIFSLKIGSLLFYDIQPCSHSPSSFINQANVKNPEQLEPYQYLSRNRCHSNMRPELGNFKFPIFGINMTLVSSTQYNIIHVGDPVSATMYYYD